ncbi:DNA-binding HxlR family transcriptional regulator [Virgibacillus natechei]|uniref:DNA-binding HxlR family transcriptional regulator n=1 Tax=Virgibacillus natechei TaxID=1216297 RepID=A0ABS4IG89_9BACI|nr:helix-turn-helix domain-containing protein [Virgibacillus natechei]MBP1969945.1 DNA-binding HxlR family transcriptional regulator [Virgibacillus natechei]UZD13392.1 helix-turn-helix transcriptional regulator [Virgibacillus natechei]
MKTPKINIADSQEPAFGYTLSLISGKWKLQIIYHLSRNGAVRYNELQRMLGKITYKTLSTTLKEMVNDGIVLRKEYPQIPPKVEYSLTEKGQTLWPVIQEMCQWGEHNQP